MCILQQNKLTDWLLTKYSQDIRQVIDDPAELEFVQHWHTFGKKHPTWPTKYLGKEAAYEGFTALGVCSKLAFMCGRTGRSWRSTYLLFKRATLPPSNLPGQLIKTPLKAS
jgi:hypothetical protein